jgi:hypothetical protein
MKVTGETFSLIEREPKRQDTNCIQTFRQKDCFGSRYYIVLAFAPAIVFLSVSVSAIFLLIWYILVGYQLWALDSYKSAGSTQTVSSSDIGTSYKNGASKTS